MNSIWSEITWRPTIGDPEPIGWIITISYLIVGSFCVSVGRKQRAFSMGRGCIGYPWFWFGLAALMFGLGINKQLDLQMLFIQIGRRVAKQGGWYSEVKTIKSAIFFCFGAVALPLVSAWMCLVCSRGRPYLLSGLGVFVLLKFIILRAMSFHPRVRQLMNFPLIGLHLNNVSELGGVTLIGLGALLATHRQHNSVKSTTEQRQSVTP